MLCRLTNSKNYVSSCQTMKSEIWQTTDQQPWVEVKTYINI